MTSSTAIVLSSGRVTPQMKMAAGPRNGPDPIFEKEPRSGYRLSFFETKTSFFLIFSKNPSLLFSSQTKSIW